jgi:hypothetical protein
MFSEYILLYILLFQRTRMKDIYTLINSKKAHLKKGGVGGEPTFHPSSCPSPFYCGDN